MRPLQYHQEIERQKKGYDIGLRISVDDSILTRGRLHCFLFPCLLYVEHDWLDLSIFQPALFIWLGKLEGKHIFIPGSGIGRGRGRGRLG